MRFGLVVAALAFPSLAGLSGYCQPIPLPPAPVSFIGPVLPNTNTIGKTFSWQRGDWGTNGPDGSAGFNLYWSFRDRTNVFYHTNAGSSFMGPNLSVNVRFPVTNSDPYVWVKGYDAYLVEGPASAVITRTNYYEGDVQSSSDLVTWTTVSNTHFKTVTIGQMMFRMSGQRTNNWMD